MKAKEFDKKFETGEDMTDALDFQKARRVNQANSLAKLGADLSSARKRRRISTVDMAERLNVSRPTLKRIESGDPGVAIGSYAMALEIFGMLDRLADLAAARYDAEGLELETKRLPKRISTAASRIHGKAAK